MRFARLQLARGACYSWCRGCRPCGGYQGPSVIPTRIQGLAQVTVCVVSGALGGRGCVLRIGGSPQAPRRCRSAQGVDRETSKITLRVQSVTLEVTCMRSWWLEDGQSVPALLRETSNSRPVVFSWSFLLLSVAVKRAYVRAYHRGKLMAGIPDLSCLDRHPLFSLWPTLC
jgi:hypothetical protein